jgi:hypothetical protein
VDLMLGKLQRLSSATQAALQQLAMHFPGAPATGKLYRWFGLRSRLSRIAPTTSFAYNTGG